MRITVDTSQIDQLRVRFARFSDRRFAAGLATGLTRTAQVLQEAEQREMRDVFDRPAPYTMRSVYLRGARADRLEARVGIADSPSARGRAPIDYLRWQIDGGWRSPKAYERALMRAGAMPDDMRSVPGRFARLDPYGNISSGQIRQILSQLRIELSSGATSALPRLAFGDRKIDRRGKVNRITAAYKRAGGQYVALPRGSSRGALLPGIYLADRFNKRALMPVLIFVPRAIYEAGNFDFHDVARRAIERNLGREIDDAMADQLRRWAAKYGVGG